MSLTALKIASLPWKVEDNFNYEWKVEACPLSFSLSLFGRGVGEGGDMIFLIAQRKLCVRLEHVVLSKILT